MLCITIFRFRPTAKYTARPEPPELNDNELDPLELACLKLVAEGVPAKKIGIQLDLDQCQVKKLLQAACKRLGSSNIFAAVIRSVRSGNIRID